MSATPPAVRFATVGTSSITSAFAAAVAEVDGARIDAVYSRDRARAEHAAAEYGAQCPPTR